MWKLLKYDIIKCRNTMIIWGAILLFYLIVICANQTRQDNIIEVTFAIVIAFNMFLFLALFSIIFRERCMKDGIVYYTGIKKRTVILEPIVFLILFCILNTFVLSLPILFENGPNHPLLNGIPTMINTKNPHIYSYLVYLLALTSLLSLYSGILLCFWSMCKKQYAKNESIRDMIGINMSIVVIISKVVSMMVLYIDYEIVINIILSIICMIIYYKKSNQRFKVER